MFDSFFPGHEAFPVVKSVSTIKIMAKAGELDIQDVQIDDVSQINELKKNNTAVFYNVKHTTVAKVSEILTLITAGALGFSTGYLAGYIIVAIASLLVPMIGSVFAIIAAIAMFALFMFILSNYLIDYYVTASLFITKGFVKAWAGISNFFFIIRNRPEKEKKKEEKAEQAEASSGPDLAGAAA